VKLAHVRSQYWRAALMATAVLCLASAAAGSLFTTAVPAPTGPNQVGTLLMRFVDPQRNDPYLANRGKRELLIRFWYPASISQGCKPAEYTSPKVWAYISQITGIDLPEIKTNSCLNAPIAHGPHPVIVVTHGYTGIFTDYTFLVEDLASRGYVIASAAHTYETTAVEFPDGRLVKSVFGSHFAPDTLRSDDQSLSFAWSVRLQDLHSVLNELERLNTAGPLAGELDMTRVAVMGHSLGGLAAAGSVVQERRFKAAVVIDAPLTRTSAAMGTDKPVLILAAGREQWSALDCQLWRNLRGPRFLVHLRGTEHLTLSDAVWAAKNIPELAAQTGTMGPEKTVAAIRNYIAAFLDTALLGKPKSPLLNTPSSHYTDAAVITQKQSLCGELVKLK
jgi:dienelactone hydrolase